ncbi:MltA domain-containing protein [Rhodopseudomonas sp. P2A-2r]|uniref:MltA domain-containing protein n=1 Tax=Rhodopseudomonas sp. P2A-2r TaxID=2991972 RepID=UPI002234E1A2|nr:MltA domain-containing protein [Rhodopseudomonas sp. P2A-2r]UZE52396.1 MltA domain-containing protein [Rhodopseudomonas sp. P2A-2r]
MGSQYAPVAWADIDGWADDDHLQAFQAFRTSCKPISAQRIPPVDSKALGGSLRDPCHVAKAADISDTAKAKAFFENNFLPLRISRLGEADGFVTGYYEPVIEGSRTRTGVYNVPVYRKPSNLFVRGVPQSATSMPNKGEVFRKIGRRKLVPYYDRAQIEDGKIAGRGLEICWLKSQTDLLFTQIQGSARVKLEDGGTVRINYEAHNGFPYTPVGRVLIDRGIVPKEQMSMQRIRQYMEENPDAANELRRQNRSYVFFREVQLSDKDEAVGAQGVPLTPGRSIAVDKSLHVYGTPFFIEGDLPIDSEQSKTPFRRLMVAQDTGSAIVGPARADLYFGAGVEAGRVAGRMRHPARFVMLVPKSIDPVARGRTMPLPEDRPSAKIAKLFPQVEPKVEPPKEPAKPVDAKPVDMTKPADVKPADAKAPDGKIADTKPAEKPIEKAADAPAAPVVKDASVPADAAKTAVPLPVPSPLAQATPQPAATAVPLPEARPQIAREQPKPKRRVHRRGHSHHRHRFFWQ